MAVIHYEPLNILHHLQKELARGVAEKTSEDTVATAEWSPAVDIKELTDKFVIHADIPGVKPEDIDISMEAGVLTVKGEKASSAKTEKEGYKRVERTYGSFYRRFSLPDAADGDAIQAQCKHGVLEITIPKRVAEQPKRIVVSEAA